MQLRIIFITDLLIDFFFSFVISNLVYKIKKNNHNKISEPKILKCLFFVQQTLQNTKRYMVSI